MLGRTNTGGGGGGGLNFKVVGGTTAPNNPKENTIWVNTETDITGWGFSAAEPAGAEGMVWIATGTASIVSFNALKKNSVVVYPLAAKQYVSGAWVKKTAQSYQNGEWHSWIIYIVENGVISDEYGFATNVINNSDYDSTITQNDGYLLMQTSGSSTSIRCTDEKVDLTGANRIELDVDPLTNYTHASNDLLSGVSLVVLSGNRSPEATAGSATTLFVAQAQTKTRGRQTLTIDNSNHALSGEYYIGVVLCAYGSGSKGKANIYNLKCV